MPVNKLSQSFVFLVNLGELSLILLLPKWRGDKASTGTRRR